MQITNKMFVKMYIVKFKFWFKGLVRTRENNLWIFLLLLLVSFNVTQAIISPMKFKKLKVGQSIKGKIGAKLTVNSKIQCSDRLVERTTRSKQNFTRKNYCC